MPAIPKDILDTVVYLYPSQEDARDGRKAGGSGCLVVVPVRKDPMAGFMYVVTNSHVIREGKGSALRVNTRDGGLGVIHSTADGWIHHPDGDDLAILSINLEYETVKARGITEEFFVTKEKLEEFQIGPGDDAFMVGRFVSHEGTGKNLPSARFGNLSQLPDEPVRTNRGLLQEVFLVECRSLPGYSGSPVFLNTLPLSMFPRKIPPIMFLGIDMGHLKDYRPVLDKRALSEGRREESDEWVVETNTGMSCVIPAWKIRDLLYCEELVKSRTEVLKHLELEKNNSLEVPDVG